MTWPNRFSDQKRFGICECHRLHLHCHSLDDSDSCRNRQTFGIRIDFDAEEVFCCGNKGDVRRYVSVAFRMNLPTICSDSHKNSCSKLMRRLTLPPRPHIWLCVACSGTGWLCRDAGEKGW